MSTVATPDAPAAPNATPEPTPAPAPTPAPSPTPAPAAPAASAPPAPVPAPTPEPAPVEYKLNLPQDSLLETSAVERILTLSKEQKFAPEAAQKVLEAAHAEAAAVIEAQKAHYTETVNGWESMVKADPEIGGKNFERTTMRTKTVMDRFASQKFKDALNATGFGNHPELVRFMDAIGAAMENDRTNPTRTSGMNDTRSVAEKMYPTSVQAS